MAYSVTLISPDGESNTIQCEEDQYILEAAEEAGVDLLIHVRQVLVLPVLVRLTLVQ